MPQDNSGFTQPANAKELSDHFQSLGDLKSEPSPNTGVAPLTFGQKLVGLTFNPSGDEKVTKAKQLCAELADLLYENSKGLTTSELHGKLYEHAIGEILNAQMNVVKVLTLKY